MKRKKIDTELLSSLSNLQPVNYSSSPEIENVYQRILNGRDSFADMYELNVNAVSEISTLDLEIKFYTEQLLKISESVANATKEIHGAASESSDVASLIAERHEDLTNTIITVSEESSNVYNKIETSQQSLTDIRELSENTITISQKMHADMSQLSDIIHNMNEVIGAIHNISAQTNLLSLNASIEAARAGEAGRGFAVVADEIRSLADETKKLTDDMGQFVSKVQSAAQESSKSVSDAIKALDEVNQKIKSVWTLNEENQAHIGEITNSISNLAAVSEEISSNMIEIESGAAEIEDACAILKKDTEGLQNIGESCSIAVKPLESIETRMDDILSHMGKMSLDIFYALSQKDLINYFDGAIEAHKKWVESLGSIINNRIIIPFQVNENKCRFGHFYNSVEPPIPEMKAIWKEIGNQHSKLHQLGSKVISYMFDNDYELARQTYDEVISVSEKLIATLENIKTKMPENSCL